MPKAVDGARSQRAAARPMSAAPIWFGGQAPWTMIGVIVALQLPQDDQDSLINQSVRNAMTCGDPGGIVHRHLRWVTNSGKDPDGWLAPAPYLTTFPRFTRHGECKVGLPDARTIKTFTCEVRWPGKGVAGLSAIGVQFELGKDSEAFTLAGQLVHMAGELTKRAVAEVAPHSEVTISDNWKPTVNDRSITLQRLFTIECRVDFRDEDKLPLFQTIMQQAARHIYGQSGLLGDGVKPEIVIHAHDFFKGHQDIALFDDAVLSGEAAIQESVDRPPAPTTTVPLANGEPVPEGFSEELMAALKS